jgi:hypothetical protein
VKRIVALALLIAIPFPLRGERSAFHKAFMEFFNCMCGDERYSSEQIKQARIVACIIGCGVMIAGTSTYCLTAYAKAWCPFRKAPQKAILISPEPSGPTQKDIQLRDLLFQNLIAAYINKGRTSPSRVRIAQQYNDAYDLLHYTQLKFDEVTVIVEGEFYLITKLLLDAIRTHFKLEPYTVVDNALQQAHFSYTTMGPRIVWWPPDKVADFKPELLLRYKKNRKRINVVQ